MEAIILGIFSFSMVLLCIVLVFFVLMQKPNADAGMGSALGGGAAETAFGGEASNILTKFTVRAVVLYFILAFCLYLGYIYAAGDTKVEVEAPTLESVTATSSTAVEQPKMEATSITDLAPATEEAPATIESPVEETAK